MTCNTSTIHWYERKDAMTRKGIGILIGATVAAVGLGVGVAAAVSSSAGTTSKETGTAAVSAVPPYSYYRSMMSRYFGGSPASMMGGSGGYGWMMGASGYRWMFGGAGAPRWMRGAQLPAGMMGTSTDMGQIMGRLWATAPGQRVSPNDAIRMADQVPVGATVDRTANTVTFTGRTVVLTAVASPPAGPDETFRIAGLTDPRVVVPTEARVTIEVVNADPDTAHGLVITASQDLSSWMPMMTGRPAFAGSALWFLGDPTSAGMHAGTLTFTASSAGRYYYLCPVPGHAQKGMTGQLVVSSAN
jgi:rusticyanin